MRKEKRVKKFLKENPEILELINQEIDQLSDNMIEDKDIPSFDDFIARHPTIIQANGEAKASKKHDWVKARPKIKWYRRKIFIVAAIVLVIVTSLSFTPVGQALAENIYRTVIQWFDGHVVIQHGQDNTVMPAQQQVPQQFKSIDDVTEKLDKQIVYSTEAQFSDIDVTYADMLIQIKTLYSFNQSEISLNQMISEGSSEWSSNVSSSNGEIIDLTVNDMHFVGYYEQTTSYVVAYMDNMSIQIFSEKTTLEDITNFIKSLKTSKTNNE